MKTSQFSAEQIIKILDQAEKGEQTIGVVCREHGITETTFYRWRRAYGGDGRQRDPAPQGVGKGERPPQAAPGRARP
ncbi:MAG: transposase [Oscillochloris sp.]|nr:transposase [Oscillochloris sp.]